MTMIEVKFNSDCVSNLIYDDHQRLAADTDQTIYSLIFDESSI